MPLSKLSEKIIPGEGVGEVLTEIASEPEAVVYPVIEAVADMLKVVFVVTVGAV